MADNKGRRWVVLIGGMHLFLTDVFLRQFDSDGYGLIIFDKPEMLTLLPNKTFPKDTCFIAVDYTNSRELHMAKTHVIKTKKVIRFITFRELATLATAQLNKQLQLEWTTPSAVYLFQHKFRYQQALFKKGLPVPLARKIESVTALKKALEDPNFATRSILKPVTGLGSIDVFDLPNQKEAAFEKVAAAGNNEEFIIEEFVEGDQYSLDGICYDDIIIELAICKKTMFPDTFVASRHEIGINLDNPVKDKLNRSIPLLLRSVGISHGFFHLQFWVKEKQIVFGEIHNRPGGTFIGPASAIVSGIRPFRALLSKKEFEEEIKYLVKTKEREFITVEILKYPNSGILRSAKFPWIIESSQVVLAHFYDNFGKSIRADLKTTFEYAGIIVAKGSSLSESRKLVIKIKEQTQFEID